MSGFNLTIKPDEDDFEAAEVLVDVVLTDRNYLFLLDTGAAVTSVISDDFTVTFPCHGQHNSAGVFAKSSDDLIKVPWLTLGPIMKKNISLARLAQNHPRQRNLIGMDVLKDHCLHFLFDENQVRVDPEDKAGYPFQDLLLGKKYHPYVDVTFGDEKVSAVWDTGAGITVVDLSLIEKYRAFFKEDGRSYGTDATGTEIETPMYLMFGAVIGSHEFCPHRVARVDLSHINSTTEIPMSLILGYSTLCQANWIFDFPERKWAVSKMLVGVH